MIGCFRPTAVTQIRRPVRSLLNPESKAHNIPTKQVRIPTCREAELDNLALTTKGNKEMLTRIMNYKSCIGGPVGPPITS